MAVSDVNERHGLSERAPLFRVGGRICRRLVEFRGATLGRGISDDLHRPGGNDLIVGQDRRITIKRQTARLTASIEVGKLHRVRRRIADRVGLFTTAFVVAI